MPTILFHNHHVNNDAAIVFSMEEELIVGNILSCEGWLVTTMTKDLVGEGKDVSTAAVKNLARSLASRIECRD